MTICETCTEFRGRNRYCRCGLWIAKGDMRICSDHPEGCVTNTRDTIEERRKIAKERHSSDWDGAEWDYCPNPDL